MLSHRASIQEKANVSLVQSNETEQGDEKFILLTEHVDALDC